MTLKTPADYYQKCKARREELQEIKNQIPQLDKEALEAQEAYKKALLTGAGIDEAEARKEEAQKQCGRMRARRQAMEEALEAEQRADAIEVLKAFQEVKIEFEEKTEAIWKELKPAKEKVEKLMREGYDLQQKFTETAAQYSSLSDRHEGLYREYGLHIMNSKIVFDKE